MKPIALKFGGYQEPASIHNDPSKNEVIRLTEAERAAFVKASQSVVDKHRKELDPKLFAYLGA
jgi:hypothetical protein